MNKKKKNIFKNWNKNMIKKVKLFMELLDYGMMVL